MPLLLSIAIVLLDGAWLFAAESAAQAEYMLKSALLFNIAKFVEWPDSDTAPPGSPLTFCMTGNQFSGTIDGIAGKTIQGRSVAVKNIAAPRDAGGCHLLYVDMLDGKRTEELWDVVAERPILTVCDRPHCAQQGVMINLQKRDEKIGLELNLDLAQQSHLKLSSQLIKLAHLVGPRQ
ncbi:MAG: YfiR family protein [Nitrospiraceae bacterium]